MGNIGDATGQLAGLTKDNASPTSEGYDSLSISTTSCVATTQLRNLSALLPHVLSDGVCDGPARPSTEL